MITNIIGVAAGAAVASLLTEKVLGAQSNLIKAAAAIAAGVAVPMFVKSDLGKSAGAGMVAVGAIDLLKQFHVISGTDGMGATPEIMISGEAPIVGADVMAGEVMAGEVMAGEVMAGEVMAGDYMSGFNDMPVLAGDQIHY
jgi:hypothetical protein